MRTCLTRAALLSGVLATTLLTSGAARANCARGAGYDATVNGNSVQICLAGTVRKCGGSIAMLRQDVSGGAVAKLVDYCVTPTQSYYPGTCYVDECVPAGTYHYGFATPYDCTEEGCGGVDTYFEAKVTTDLPATCTRTNGNSAPTTYGSAVPWTTQAFKSCPRGCSTGGPGTFAVNGVLLLGSLAVLGLRRRSRQ